MTVCGKHIRVLLAVTPLLWSSLTLNSATRLRTTGKATRSSGCSCFEVFQPGALRAENA